MALEDVKFEVLSRIKDMANRDSSKSRECRLTRCRYLCQVDMYLSTLTTKSLRGLSPIRTLSMASPPPQQIGPIETSMRTKVRLDTRSPQNIY